MKDETNYGKSTLSEDKSSILEEKFENFTDQLTEEEIKIAENRMKELYPIENIPLRNLFPTIQAIWKCFGPLFCKDKYEKKKLHNEKEIANSKSAKEKADLFK